MSLETITGNLRDAYKLIVPGTMQHADQLMKARRDDPELQNQSLNTGDGPIYFLNGKQKIPTLAMTREADNPVLLNIDDAFAKLATNGNYRVLQPDFAQALVAPETVLVALPNLRLSGDEAEWCYLEFGTAPANYNQLNYEERKLAERVHGKGKDFANNMKLLKSVYINESRIYVLNPKYVQKHAENGAFARASCLGILGNISDFSADDRRVHSLHGCVRGVRKKNDTNNLSAQKSDNSFAQKYDSPSELLLLNRGRSLRMQSNNGLSDSTTQVLLLSRDMRKTTPHREHEVSGPSI